MGPRRKSSISTEPLVALISKGNRHRFFSSEMYLNVIFRMDRFREVFKLPDFGSRDFDGALVYEQNNYIYDMTRNISPLIKKIFIALAKPYYKGSFNESTYQSALYDVIARKKPLNRPNPLGKDPKNSDIHRLPTEVKIYLISLLLDLRVAKDESELVDGYHNAADLRISSLGIDSLDNSYYYFGDFRIFIETRLKQEYSSCVESDCAKQEWIWVFKELGLCQFICLAENKDEWKAVIDVLKSLNKCDKDLSIHLQSLMNREQDKFNAELSRRSKIHNEEARLLAKKEMEILKELGMVRSSGRLQAKEIERRKVEEERKRQIEEERMACMDDITNGRPLRSSLNTLRPITRAERIAFRLAKNAQQFQIPIQENELIVKESCSISGRFDSNGQLNSSLNDDDVQRHNHDDGLSSEFENRMKDIVEQPKRPRLAMILNKNKEDVKEEESDLQIQSGVDIPIEDVEKERSNISIQSKTNVAAVNREDLETKESNNKINLMLGVHAEDLAVGKKERNFTIESGVNAKPYICSPFYTLYRRGQIAVSSQHYYTALWDSKEDRDSDDYRSHVMVGQRFFQTELRKRYDIWRKSQDTNQSKLYEYECMLDELVSPPNSTMSKLHVVEKLDIVCGNEDLRKGAARDLLTVSINFIRRCWNVVYDGHCREDLTAVAILDRLHALVAYGDSNVVEVRQ